MIRVGAIALLLLLAGCIELPEDPTDPQPREPATGGSMSATETQSDASELCTDGVDLSAERRFCATRVVSVTGRISGFDLFDVALQTFNGPISIGASQGDAWQFTATLKARGSTAEGALAAIDDIDFRWAHEDATGHFLEVIAEHEGSSDGRSAQLDLKMPAALVMRMTATTSNGDVTMSGARTDGLALTTSNGEIVARADATQVALTTSNGDIDADLTPSGSGNWMIVTSNGEITLTVPEGARYGYSMEGTTSNGEVDFTLREGTEGPCPQGSQYYTPPCNHRTFETNGLRSRDARVQAQLITSNGDIDVAPA